jgi:hypothetical protein
MSSECAGEFTVYKKEPARPTTPQSGLKPHFVQPLTDPRRVAQLTAIALLLSTPEFAAVLTETPVMIVDHWR